MEKRYTATSKILRGCCLDGEHGDTREVFATLIYEELSWFKFREENGRVIIEDFGFNDVEQSTYPIKSKEYFKQYCISTLTYYNISRHVMEITIKGLGIPELVP